MEYSKFLLFSASGFGVWGSVPVDRQPTVQSPDPGLCKRNSEDGKLRVLGFRVEGLRFRV